MVKNTGGNKSKKIARKNVSSAYTTTNDVRKATDANEIYAVVTKIFSSQRCSVTGADGNIYQCTIRGKFLKNKRSGEGLVIGAWILIGFYDWEVRSDGTKKCDLLEIYSNTEKDKLKQLETRHLAVLLKMDGNDCTFSNFHINPDDDKEEEDDKDKEDDDSSSGSDEEEKIEKEKETLVVDKKQFYNTTPIQKETAREQLDWLSITDNDI